MVEEPGRVKVMLTKTEESRRGKSVWKGNINSASGMLIGSNQSSER